MSLPIRRKPPKEFRVDVTDAPIVVVPLSAERMGTIDDKHPVDPETKRRPHYYAYLAAIISAAVFTQAGTTEQPKPGEQAWTETDIRTMDSEDFYELWAIVGDYLGLRESDEKKATTGPGESGSPSS